MLPNWAVDDDRLGGYDLLVYMALIRHADNTGVCWPSLERLAKIARCSQPTVSKSLNVLEQLVHSTGQVRWQSNRYHVSLWKPTPKQGYDHAPTPKPAFDPPKPAFDPPQNEVLTNNTQENKTQEQYSRDEKKITVTCHSVDTLKALMALWPKKCRVSNEFIQCFNQAFDEVGADALMRAAKRFVESCEGTPLQYVRTLPCGWPTRLIGGFRSGNSGAKRSCRIGWPIGFLIPCPPMWRRFCGRGVRIGVPPVVWRLWKWNSSQTKLRMWAICNKNQQCDIISISHIAEKGCI